MQKRWISSLFWVLNALTLVAFTYLLIVTVWEIIREGFHENLEVVLAVILWGYMIFSIIQLGKYLLSPSPEKHLDFLWLSLGFILLVVFTFLIIVASFGGLGPT